MTTTVRVGAHVDQLVEVAVVGGGRGAAPFRPVCMVARRSGVAGEYGANSKSPRAKPCFHYGAEIIPGSSRKQRGWFIGSEEFRETLNDLLMGRTGNDNYRGEQRRDHGMAEAERLLAAGLAELGRDEAGMLVSPDWSSCH